MTHCENNALGRERLPEKLASVATLHARSLSVSSFYAPADREIDRRREATRVMVSCRHLHLHLADTHVRLDARTPPGQLAAPASPSTPLVTDTTREADEGGGGMVSHSHAAAPPVRCGLVNLKFGDAAGATAE